MGEAASVRQEEATAQAPADATPVRELAKRDGAIALALLSLFAAADTWAATSGLAFASLLAVLVGASVGWVLGLGAHEWGHFAGARGAGGTAPTRPYRSLFPIFDLDMQASDPAAFRAMSVGGNAAHWALVLAAALFIGTDTNGRAALLAATFAFALSASLTEFPVIHRAFTGSSPVESFQGLTGEKLKRNNRLGAAAGIVLFVLV